MLLKTVEPFNKVFVGNVVSGHEEIAVIAITVLEMMLDDTVFHIPIEEVVRLVILTEQPIEHTDDVTVLEILDDFVS